MEDDKKSVKPVTDDGNNQGGNSKILHAVPSSESSEQIKRPRLMTVEEARWIAGGKKMKVIL